ncbi:MAG: TonB-dependent receptor [Woeseiaceae bacterium]|nr:TonB-dependent receptor [Woeseiaceae bacterium]NIP19540.1 TonB-dependent receptor [Woeseiaceae bacterium]NIS88494.1 TonB-dependent receptor [Woeseiaceae bacterium]
MQRVSSAPPVCAAIASVCSGLVPLVAPAQLAPDQDALRRPLDEIVVTAQKRSQLLQEIPAAITAVERETFTVRGITTLADVQNLVPSVRLQKESASTEIYIRGVGSTLDLPMIEPPNAYNINGVYVPREVTSASLVDVERMEFLPGPQGTLYGRGAIGGVVNTITQRPGDDLETRALVEAGNFSHVRATLSQTIPVSDNASLRASVSYFDRDGYLASDADSADDLAGFVAFEASPGESVNIHLWGHVESRDGYAANLLSKGSLANPKSQAFPNKDPWDDRLLGDLEPFATLGPIDAQYRDWDTTLIGAEVNWAINDSLELTYIPSYLDFEWRQEYWLTHKDGDFNETIDQQTHELRLAYDAGGKLTWLGGLYAYDIETTGQLFIQFGPDELFPGSPAGLWLDASDVRDHQLRGSALFGELRYALSDTLRLVAGGRISNDKRTGAGFQPDIVVGPVVDEDPVALFTGVAPPSWSNSESWDHVDWKLGVEIDTGQETLVYATAQTGFQPGTFDVFPDTVTKESELLSFTVGARSRLADGRLVFNNEVFYYLYDNLLTQAFNAATGTNFLTNADTVIYGWQSDLAYAPASLENTQFRFSLGYLHARYDDFLEDSLDVFNDNQMQNAPDWTATLGIVHDWMMSAGAFIRADLVSRYESGFWGNFSHSPGMYQASYTKTDLALTWHSGTGRWTAGVWLKNFENADVQAAAATGNPITDPGPGAPFLEAPRTWGVRVTLNL